MSIAMARSGPIVLALLRIMSALLFLEDGLMKLILFPVPLPGVSYPLPAILLVAGGIEVVAGTLLLVGLFTRSVALLASGEMAFAYFLVHAPRSFWPGANDGAAAILFCFVFLHLAASGGGRFSLDSLLYRRKNVPGD